MASTFRIKRRATGGAAGPPATLAAAELAFNEVDDTLYYGKGDSSGVATSIIPIGGANYADTGGGGSGSASGFTAYSSADQTIANLTWTKLLFGSTAYNHGSFYSIANCRWTPPAGETSFVASAYCEGLINGGNVYIALYKNGTLFRYASNNTTDGYVQLATNDNANGTDYYEVWIQGQTSGGTFSVLTGQNDATYFQGFQPCGAVGPQGAPGVDGVSDGDKGDVTVTGSGTAWAIKAFVSASQGDILYRGASGWVKLGAGSAGQILTSGGAGANPSWTTPAAGGFSASSTAPGSPSPGNWWYNLATGVLSVYIFDGNTSQWVAV